MLRHSLVLKRKTSETLAGHNQARISRLAKWCMSEVMVPGAGIVPAPRGAERRAGVPEHGTGTERA